MAIVSDLCIYCGREASASLEHIWPKALGGVACGPLFKTRQVCRGCNSRLGQWVDGAFLKSWFVQQERELSALAYLDPAGPGILSYAFKGIDPAFPCGVGELCERWSGPSGEDLYFVHQEDDPAWLGYAGGDMLRRKRVDPGRVYFWLADRGERRALAGLVSAIDQFGSARLHCLTGITGAPERITRALVSADNRSGVEAGEIAWIRERPRDAQQLRASMSIDYSDRFLAKLALGFGSTILGVGFTETTYAAELRRMLLSPGDTTELKLLRGGGAWQQPRGQFRQLAIEKAWTLIFLSTPEGLGLMVILPTGRELSILIANREAMSDEVAGRYAMGSAFGVVPVRRYCAGPFSLLELVQHRQSANGPAGLRQLDAWRFEAATTRTTDFR